MSLEICPQCKRPFIVSEESCPRCPPPFNADSAASLGCIVLMVLFPFLLAIFFWLFFFLGFFIR